MLKQSHQSGVLGGRAYAIRIGVVRQARKTLGLLVRSGNPASSQLLPPDRSLLAIQAPAKPVWVDLDLTCARTIFPNFLDTREMEI